MSKLLFNNHKVDGIPLPVLTTKRYLGEWVSRHQAQRYFEVACLTLLVTILIIQEVILIPTQPYLGALAGLAFSAWAVSKKSFPIFLGACFLHAHTLYFFGVPSFLCVLFLVSALLCAYIQKRPYKHSRLLLCFLFGDALVLACLGVDAVRALL